MSINREGLAKLAADMGITLDQLLEAAKAASEERRLAALTQALDECEQERRDARTLRWLRVHATEMSVAESDGELCMTFKSPEDFDRQVAEAMARAQS